MYRVWSTNTRNKKILWLMGEYDSMDKAMKKAERVVLDSSIRVDEVNFERADVTDKRTNTPRQSVICYSHDEVVGSVITGPDLDLGQVADRLP